MSDAYTLFREGQKRLRTGMAAQATVPLEKAKRLEPEKASIREALGIAYFRLARWEDAEREFRAIVEELSPTDHYAHYALGRVAGAAGTDGRGERALQARELDGPGLGDLRRRASSTSTTGESGPPAGRRAPRHARRRDRRRALHPPRRRGRGRRGRRAARLADKVARLRIFENEAGKFDRSLLDTGGAALVVSQFTLIADTAQGQPAELLRRRPARGGRAALRAVLRGAARARRPGRDRRLRRADVGRARRTTARSRSS